MNAIAYKEVFPHIMKNELWFGASIHCGDVEFGIPAHYVVSTKSLRTEADGRRFIRVIGIRWFTNIDHKQGHDKLNLCKKYNPTDYPKYDNYDAINVDKVSDIPEDYFGVMGVPITFLDKYCPSQFNIVGLAQGSEDIAGEAYLGIIDTINYNGGKARPYLNGKSTYNRIFIKRK